MKKIFWEDVEPGTEVTTLPIVATSAMLVRFAGAGGDFNPLHYEDNFAKAAGQPRPIVHGQLKRAWLVQLAVNWANGDPGALKKLSVRFKAVDLPRFMKTMTESHDGETWACKGKVTKKRDVDGEKQVDCEIWVENGKGEKTTTGTATVVLPSRNQ
ncbi:MAG: MaoC/PaaZ C-terminal domain-containing protein [Dehalococcoidia bacterium]|nr:MaoC/PaaZ C-terminal domain-containing protein [Dehalococcoidia bacterium]